FPFVSAHIARKAIVLPIERKVRRHVKVEKRFYGLNNIIGFYARYQDNGKRQTRPLGKDPVAAYTQFTQIERDFARVRVGLLPLNPPEPKPQAKSDRDLRACAAEYKANLATLGKKKSTIGMYSRAVDDFISHCQKSSIDDVDRKDILNYMGWMRANVKKREGDPQHALRNRVRYLSTFFNTFGLKCPLPMREIKKPVKTRPWKYSLDVINLF